MVQHMIRRQEWVPLQEAAKLYRVTTETMLSWTREGKFKSQYEDEILWISRSELYDALRNPPLAEQVMQRQA